MTTPLNRFEGPEKKLEIILSSPRPALRDNGDGRWRAVVRASGAEIISHRATDVMDAYLLSESSLFVWDDRVLMITCGQTTPVNALPEILQLVGRANVGLVFYERKNLFFPERQPSNFEGDVARIEAFFPGRSYRLGPMQNDHVKLFHSCHARPAVEQDVTLQVFMHELDPALMNICSAFGRAERDRQERLSRLRGLYRDAVVDSHLFTPCGYSLNGLIKDRYYTIHITPQPGCSYASFETNLFEKNFQDAICEVVAVLKPRRFSTMLTTSMDAECMAQHAAVEDPAPGYDRVAKRTHAFECGYAVTFINCRARENRTARLRGAACA
jgi:S-adenosylmethionine decarboxylase